MTGVLAGLLEEQAERCITLAYRCENKTAERIMRALAVDLALGASEHRGRVAAVAGQLAELTQLSRLNRLADSAVTLESASTA